MVSHARPGRGEQHPPPRGSALAESADGFGGETERDIEPSHTGRNGWRWDGDFRPSASLRQWPQHLQGFRETWVKKTENEANGRAGRPLRVTPFLDDGPVPHLSTRRIPKSFSPSVPVKQARLHLPRRGEGGGRESPFAPVTWVLEKKRVHPFPSLPAESVSVTGS